MSDFEIVAEPRTELGKGATRRLRRAGMVPGIVYGGSATPANIVMPARVIRKQLENEAFYSTILTVKTPGGVERVVLKDLQRHPTTSDVMHLDLQRATETQVLHMRVPLHFVNEDSSPGRKAGGVVQHAMIDVDVTCMAKDLPEYIEIDIGALDVGGNIHLSDIATPDGVELTALGHGDESQDLLVASIVAARETDDAETVEGEEVEDEDSED